MAHVMCCIMQGSRLRVACRKQQKSAQQRHKQNRSQRRDGGFYEGRFRQSYRRHSCSPDRHTRQPHVAPVQGRSPGLRVDADFRLPTPVKGSGRLKARSPHYSRGGGWGFGHLFRFAFVPFPFQSRRFALMEHLSPVICTVTRRWVKPICAACGPIATPKTVHVIWQPKIVKAGRENLNRLMRGSAQWPWSEARPEYAHRQDCHRGWRDKAGQR